MKTKNLNALKQEVTEQTETFSPSLSLLPSVKVLFFVGFALLTLSAQMRGENLTGNSTVDGDLSVGNSTNKGNVLITGKTGGSAGDNLKIVGEGKVIFQATPGIDAEMVWDPMNGSFRSGYASVGGLYSFAAGFGSWANGDYSVAMGWGSYAAEHSFAFGELSMAGAPHSVALTASYSFGILGFAVAGGIADGDCSIGLGGWAGNTGAIATTGGLALGEYSVAIGPTTASASYSFVFGRYNVISGNSTVWISTDDLLALGNGTDSNNRHNALTVLKNGKMSLFPTSSNTSSIVLDPNAPQITVGNQTVMTSNSTTGNVGINTSAPQTKLQVNDISGGNAAVHGDLFVSNSSGLLGLGSQQGLEFKASAFGGGFGFRMSNPDFGSGNTPLVFESRANSGNWTELARLTNDGKLGIGTTSPTSKLDVGSGDIHLGTVGALSRLIIEGDTSGHFWTIGSGATSPQSYFQITNRFGANWPVGFVLTKEGNVGIGMTAPAFRLETAGPASFGDGPFIRNGGVKDTRYYDQQAGAYFHTPGAMVRKDSSTTNMAQAPATLVLYNKDGTDNAGAKLTFAANETTASNANPVALAAIASQKISGVADNWATGNLKFLVKSGSSYVDVATMRASGNVGIGTASPTAKLDVNGDARFSGAVRIEPQGDLSMGEFTN